MSPPALPKPAGYSLRILLAEDNKINQQLVTMLLRKAGHQVDVADNGELAVEAISNGEYDAVLMDVQMPVLDGVEATRRIRALPPPKNAIAVIALTAHAMAGAKEEYLAAEMDDYLSKPIDNIALFTCLDNIAARAGGRSTALRASAGGALLTTMDPARLEMIAEAMEGEPLDAFFDVFLASTAERIGRIREFAEHGDLPQIGREAHTLFGTAGNFGALRLGWLATELKSACDAGDHARARDLAGELPGAMDAARAAVLDWLNGNRTPQAA